MNRKFLPSLALALGFLFYGAASLRAETVWRQYGFNSTHTSFNESEMILTRANVSQLTWVWSGKIGRAVGSAPIFGRATVFVASDGHVVALKVHTGERR